MRARRILMLALIVVLPTAADAVTVRGAPSCGEWVKARPEQGQPPGDAQPVERWLIGFLSGLAVGSKVDLLRGTDNPSLYLWMDNYCRANPLKNVAEGARDLFSALQNKLRPKKPPRSASGSST